MHTDNVEYIKVSGKILFLFDGVASVIGLRSARVGEIVYFLRNDVNFEDGTELELLNDEIFIRGLVLSLNAYDAFVIVLGNECFVNAGSLVFRSGSLFNLNTSLRMFGRVINALGQCKESFKDFSDVYNECSYYIERKASGIVDRVQITIPLQTGIKSIDTLLPIGRGQRELIIGDRQTGKTSIAIDTILNYVESNNYFIESFNNLTFTNLKEIVWFVYSAVGQKQSSVSQVRSLLMSKNASWFTAIVAATAAESATLQFLAPYVACTLGEFIRDTLGGHCLVIYDDLSKHAVAYRQMSLLLRRPPGREAFPGDVFYVHSRLLERAGYLRNIFYYSRIRIRKMNFVFRNLIPRGTLTAFPIIETQAGDVSAYIPTNVISITDGQIFLETELFYRGIRPAINIGLSVSRIGSAAQPSILKKVAGSLKVDLAQFREIEGFAKLGAVLDDHTEKLLVKGENLVEILKQDLHIPFSTNIQLFNLFFGLGFTSNWLTQIIKTIKCFNNSFLSISRLKFSWFELFRLNFPNFEVAAIKLIFNSFLSFINIIGIVKLFRFNIIDTFLNLLIIKFPMVYFDDFFLFYLIETSSLSFISSLKLNTFSLKFLTPVMKKKRSIFSNFDYLFYKNQKLSLMQIFNFSDDAINFLKLNFSDKFYFNNRDNNNLLDKFMLFIYSFMNYGLPLYNEDFFFVNSQLIFRLNKLINLLFIPFFTERINFLPDTLKEYTSFFNLLDSKEIFYTNCLFYINMCNNFSSFYFNLFFFKKKVNKFFNSFSFSTFNLKTSFFIFFNKISFFLLSYIFVDIYKRLKFNSFIFDNSVFERSLFVFILLLLLQNFGSFKHLSLLLNKFSLMSILVCLFSTLSNLDLSFLTLFFGFTISKKKLINKVMKFFFINIYRLRRFFVWFSKLPIFFVNLVEEFNFSILNFDIFIKIYFNTAFKFSNYLNNINNYKLILKCKDSIKLFLFIPTFFSFSKFNSMALILNMFYLSKI